MKLEDLLKPTTKPSPMAMVADYIKNDYVYCLENGTFYTYDNGYWKAIFTEELLSCMEEKCPGIRRFKPGIKEEAIKHLKVLTHKRLELFNTHDLLNFPTGMFDAKGNNFISHNPNFLSTIRINYKYDLLAECPLWINTLNGILENNQDKINIIQEFFGYCLTRDVSREKALLLLGESRSGKSTILETISGVVGEENTSSVSLEKLEDSQYTAMLINKMINIDWDVSGGAERFEAKFKIITSGEPVEVNQKYIKAFTFRPYCKLILAANKFPRITDHSSAFYKRLILIPCNRVFEPEEQDLTLKIKLRKEYPGIFNWALKGLHRLEKRGGFEVGKSFMVDAIEELREESNPIDVFLKENIVPDLEGDCKIEKGELYIRYSNWCKENGNQAMSAIKFGQYFYHKYSKYTPKNAQCSLTGKRIWRNLRYIDQNGGSNAQEITDWQDTA